MPDRLQSRIDPPTRGRWGPARHDGCTAAILTARIAGMTIFLPALTVACGAFFVWLTVWVVNRREYWGTWRRVLFRSFKRTLPWGTTLAVVVVGVLWFVVG